MSVRTGINTMINKIDNMRQDYITELLSLSMF